MNYLVSVVFYAQWSSWVLYQLNCLVAHKGRESHGKLKKEKRDWWTLPCFLKAFTVSCMNLNNLFNLFKLQFFYQKLELTIQLLWGWWEILRLKAAILKDLGDRATLHPKKRKTPNIFLYICCSCWFYHIKNLRFKRGYIY